MIIINRYELHMHTSEASACGRSSGAEMVDFYISNGYSGAVVTDHFYHGNTRPDRSLPWNDYIDSYISGYENMKKSASGRDFDVFFGIEEGLGDGSEFIAIGITPEWLKAHPELKDANGKKLLGIFRGAGAFIIQAHPYRERDYMTSHTVTLYPHDVDAVEVYNCCNSPQENRRAYEYCKDAGLLMTGGSDRHIATLPSPPLGGIELPYRCHTANELTNAIRMEKANVIGIETILTVPLTEPSFAVKTV